MARATSSAWDSKRAEIINTKLRFGLNSLDVHRSVKTVSKYSNADIMDVQTEIDLQGLSEYYLTSIVTVGEYRVFGIISAKRKIRRRFIFDKKETINILNKYVACSVLLPLLAPKQ